ncbi:excinuclease ABC subunit UvrB [Estrella lausannensis]|uniref:UvrABC system protein B n=1 Tax=Estrella lausannensis TaxID=483423 RepID=A0A0H5DMM1_9BACT|nr:excinuclease ABC subunit UvrB [Estrella lausannensis]CRX37366.1 UvrABC system protein B [Estrella lausannensis]
MFHLKSDYSPKGDQPRAIEELSKGVKEGKRSQVLLGVTGSGKTFTMANIIAEIKRPALVLAHNKTLAAQLYQEFKAFFPNNAVEYFVSYYDYYQPEAYIPRTDTYIEKDMAINDQIDRMRLSATRSLLERDDVVIIASVSCIYGLGSPEYYRGMNLRITKGEERRRDDVLLHLVEMQYKRNDFDFSRGTFRVRGDVLDIFPAYEEDKAFRVEFFGDEIDKIVGLDPLTGRKGAALESITIYPGSHHVTPEEVRLTAIEAIKKELEERVAFFESEKRYIEAQRILERTRYDLEMIKEVGFCKGIENYSRHFARRNPGDPPSCLIDYFPKDYLLFVDESHQTIPQLHAMYNGDKARKKALVDFGFRLPSAYDNRPLKFEESYDRFNQVIYVSATPSPWEIRESNGVVVEQIIRPTGLLDPVVEIKPASSQVDDCLELIKERTEKGARVLVTTLTKRLAEELTGYLNDLGIKAKYLHSDIDTLERMQIIHELRLGKFDVLVGINLLREGLDIPEVSLVAILDADKEGFLRSETALIQTCGRAARNSEGKVVMYADKETASIKRALLITKTRREIQDKYNKEHGITPKTVFRSINALVEEYESVTEDSKKSPKGRKKAKEEEESSVSLDADSVRERVKEYESKMKKAAQAMEYEEAAKWRDLMRKWTNIEMRMGHDED